jgi:N,N-dimethylformamidase
MPSIHGYSDRICVAPNESIRFMVSAEGTETYQADVVRLIHGDTNPAGPGFKEEVVDTPLNGQYWARHQPTHAGSHVVVADTAGRLGLTQAFTLHAFICPTLPDKGRQGILTRWSDDQRAGYCLTIDVGARLALWLGNGDERITRLTTGERLLAGVWYAVGATYDGAAGRAGLFLEQVVNATNGLLGRAHPRAGLVAVEAEVAPGSVSRADAPFVMAAYAHQAATAGHFNGKIDAPRVYRRALDRTEIEALTRGDEPNPDALVARWDLADGIGLAGIPTDRVTDVSRNGLHGSCFQMPARGMTGHNWTSEEENFVHRPDEYGAIHFHDDDIEDSGWEMDFELTIPPTLGSDVYAARLRAGDAEEYIPFFVRPPSGAATARILFLAPTASYMAYANFHGPFDAAPLQAVAGRTPMLSEQDIFLYQHPEYGLSTYDVHSDGSGVCYASRLRPMIDMRPKHRFASGGLWQFPADLHLIDWLNAMGHHYDVATDEDLHREGVELLRHYNVVLTGTHPEYYSTAMLDGLEAYIHAGGRVMYLGGNGFYWIISYHPDKRHLLEVRRGESGSRAWQARPGEYFHSTTGERGGLWRNRARPPQKLVGVGFTAEGFDTSSYYRRLPDSFDPRAGFIFEGVGDDDLIGDFGLVGGGAAGFELDRYDLLLGTPPDALLVASSEGHSDNYPHVVEEIFFMFPGLGGTQDPAVRADMVYFANSNGGAVFSTGSISWCGSLSHKAYANNVSRITDNVLRQFATDERPPWN